MSETVKQVIVMRTDLGMRKGKMIAQGAHSSLAVLLRAADSLFVRVFTWITRGKYLCIPLDESTGLWLRGKFTKICVGIDSEAGLVEIYEKAKAAGLPTTLIVDAGLTEFNGVPTKTCCAIGPGKVEEINEITGHLKLL